MLNKNFGYLFKNPAFTIERADLMSAGNIGLVRAIEKFRPARGAKLVTYASFWIRQQMGLFIERHQDIIRVPRRATEKGAKPHKFVADYDKVSPMISDNT